MRSPRIGSVLLGACRGLAVRGRGLSEPARYRCLASAASVSPAACRALPLGGVRLFASFPPHSVLDMPSLSPTMEEGTLVSWSVKEGQEIAPGDAIADVETDKATITWENQDDGVVAKLLVPAGTSGIKVGAPVLVLAEDAADVPAFASFSLADAGVGGGAGEGAAAAAATPDAAPSAAPAATPDAAATPAPSSSVPVSHLLGPAARIILEAAGLTRQDAVPTFPGGIVTKADALRAVEAHKGGAAKAPASASAPASAPAPSAPAPSAAPSAPSAPRSFGRRGSLRASPKDPAPYDEIPTSGMRKVIAKRLTESKQTIPHVYFSAEVKVGALEELRAALKRAGRRASVNDAVVAAAARALAAAPAANAAWDAAAEAAVPFSSVDVSVAVATPKGLLTPVVKGADAKGVEAISAEIRALTAKARDGKLLPEEYTGGSFTVSNLGMFGVDAFKAIINPGQGAIMAVAAASPVTVVGPDGALATEDRMAVTLSADARVFDGAVARDFLQAFKEAFENPIALV